MSKTATVPVSAPASIHTRAAPAKAQSHAATLSARHATLEARLLAENARPNPDTAIIAELKKAKLKIKDWLSAR